MGTPPVKRQTQLKTLPFRNFFGGQLEKHCVVVHNFPCTLCRIELQIYVLKEVSY